MKPYGPVGGKEILCIVVSDCRLDGPGEVGDEVNEEYVCSFKPDRNFDPKEMYLTSG